MKNFSFRNKTTTYFIFNILLILLLLLISYPLYRAISFFSNYTGMNKLGDNEFVKNSIILETKNNDPIILDRTLNIVFKAEVDENLNWNFEALEKNAEIKIGENKIVKYKGTNISNNTITSTADFKTNPENAFPYLIKTECFCFQEQTLDPGESEIFTMIFYIDPSLDNDSKFDALKEVVFTYKFSEIKS